MPNKEFRLAVARPFLEGKINVGVNMMIARGYTGQTTENFATDYRPGYVGPLPVPENPIAEVVGVRIPSHRPHHLGTDKMAGNVTSQRHEISRQGREGMLHSVAEPV